MAPTAKVSICGLGPGGVGQITEATAELVGGPDPVYLRTSRHPSAERVSQAISFDDVYEQAESFDEVYQTITDTVIDGAKTSGHVVYAVPGSPLVLERSVRHLRASSEVDVTLLPAVSFLDEVWARLQVDPVDDGVRMVDGLRFATDAAGERGPLLVAHVHSAWVLSDIKLALDAGPEQQVTVLQRLGTPEERIFDVAWPDLDRVVEADHLTTLYLPTLAAPVGYQLSRSVEMMRRLRRDCPWDREQSHRSLRKFLIEESYEVLDAIDGLGGPDDDPAADAYADLEEELGDLWFQILFHAELAAEAGQFTIAEVAEGLYDKMVRRHPHVYGGEDAIDASIPANWEQLKQQEKQRGSILDGIPTSLPALALTEKTLKKAAGAGREAALDEPGEALAQFVPDGVSPDDVATVLLTVVELARRQGINAEEALRAKIRSSAERFRATEGDGSDDRRWIAG
jgi:tetrapyrrole methylase family protein/MazG family protein